MKMSNDLTGMRKLLRAVSSSILNELVKLIRRHRLLITGDMIRFLTIRIGDYKASAELVWIVL